MNIGLLGFGTIGKGVFELIKQSGKHQIVKVLEHPDEIKTLGTLYTDDFEVILKDASIDVIIEVLGGYETAYQHIKAALHAKKHVVTANKHVVSYHLKELMVIAKDNGVSFLYEASVGGGIPLIKTIFDYLKSYPITEVTAILNGTTNYILSQVFHQNETIENALIKARQNGFAELDSTADVAGFDSTRKIAIIASLSLKKQLNPDLIFRYGIGGITNEIIDKIKQKNYVLKLLSSFSYADDTLSIGTYPTLLPKEHLLAQVKDEENIIIINEHHLHPVTLIGKGAGRYPTAAAIINNIEDIGIQQNNPFDNQQSSKELTSFTDVTHRYAIYENGKLILKEGIVPKEIDQVAFYAKIID